MSRFQQQAPGKYRMWNPFWSVAIANSSPRHLSFGNDPEVVPSALTNENRFFPEYFARLPMSYWLLWFDDKVGVWKKSCCAEAAARMMLPSGKLLAV